MAFYSIALQACPLYVAEIAPKEVRGVMVAMVNVVGASGLVVRHYFILSILIMWKLMK